MELYHGTTSGSIESIEESGILGSEGDDGKAWMSARKDIAQKYGRDGAEGQGDDTYAVVVVDSNKVPKLQKEEFEGVWSAPVVPKRAVIRIDSYDATTGQKLMKRAYVSPPQGELVLTIIRDANPRVQLGLDLGIPNFTVFSMTLPLAEGQPGAMSQLIAEAVHILLDEAAAFMLSMEYEEDVIVEIYATVLAAFKGMSTEADPAKEQSATGQDPTVSTYEGTFEIPMTFINETQRKVVTGSAKKIRHQPPVRHIELTYSPKDRTKPSDTARVIRMYRDRSIKQMPKKPMYVVVYDNMGRPAGTIPIGPGKNFKNELLRLTHGKRASVDFSEPVSFPNEQEMKSSPLSGIPRAISVGGMTYQPEAMSGGDMALYHGPQDYIVKFPDGRAQVFPGRPTFRKMRNLNFPVPRNRFRWTLIPQDAVQQPKDMQAAPEEEVKEAAAPEPETPEQPAQPQKKSPYAVASADVERTSKGSQSTVAWLKPTRTYDDLVPVDILQKRLVRDKLQGRQILMGSMVVDRVGYYGTVDGEKALLIPQYFVRRYGVLGDDGTYKVYHLRRDGRAQRVGVRPITKEDFRDPQPIQSIDTQGA